MITPDDIRNPKRKSGFNHVSPGSPPGPNGNPAGPNAVPKWAAARRVRPGSAPGSVWHGPRRLTALEAAQDYCDYINGQPISTPSVPKGRAGVKLAGHVFDGSPEPIPSDIEAAYGMIKDYRAQKAGKPGYVYLIVEQWPSGSLAYGKIGYSTNPQKRVAELQTGNPRTLKLYATKLGSLEDEAALHKRHIEKNVLQEWFRLDDALLSEFPTTEEEE